MQFKQFALKWVEIIFDGVFSFVCSRVGSIHCLMNQIRTCRVPLGTNETRGHWMVWAHYLQTANPLHNHNDVFGTSVRSFLIFIPLYSIHPNRHICTFISGKVRLLILIEAKRQTLPEINVYTRLFGSIEYLWTLTKSGQFWTTYLPRLVNVVCEQPPSSILVESPSTPSNNVMSIILSNNCWYYVSVFF